MASNGDGGNNDEAVGVAQANPNTTTDPLALDNTLTASGSIGIDTNDAMLVCNILPSMADDNNQLLP